MKIVFAHFNSKIPKYLLLNLKRTILLFPLHEVYLITDQDVGKIKIKNLSVSKYNVSENWNYLEELIQHPKFFRNNFWFTSLARLIAIAEFVKNHNEEILHIESDVIISSDFPFQVFSKLNVDFSFPVVNSDQAIASCLYIGNSRAADELIRISLESAAENNLTTDMYVLKRLAESKITKFQLLPSSISSREALDNANEQFLLEIKEALSIYSGIFDGSDIGLYLFGEDPRNNRGLSKLRYRKYINYLNVRKLFIISGFNREFPYVSDLENNVQIPIYSLHIHSKNPNLFKVNRIRKIISKSVKASVKEPKNIFSPMIFIRAVKNSIFRRIRYYKS